MNKILFFLLIITNLGYGAVFDLEFSKNNIFISGKLDIIDRKTKLDISNHQIKDSFSLQLIHFVPLLPNLRFDYIPYSYTASGKVEINMIDVLEEADFPIFFGTSGLVVDSFFFGDFFIFDFFGDNDTVDLDIDINIKEYNLTLFYQPFYDAKISPKYGVYLKYIKSDVKRTIETQLKDIKDSSTSSRIVPFLFLGLDINVPFPALNLLFRTSTETRFLKYKDTIYYQIEIMETLYFTDIKYLNHTYISVGYRHWRLKTDYESDGYQVEQRLRWNISFIQIGLRF
ncbi:MAG: hypothetical protein GXO22_00845 [Aquificae bacterium]|nr:hypothetical protein [Aquificota bacterium]